MTVAHLYFYWLSSILRIYGHLNSTHVDWSVLFNFVLLQRRKQSRFVTVSLLYWSIFSPQSVGRRREIMGRLLKKIPLLLPKSLFIWVLHPRRCLLTELAGVLGLCPIPPPHVVHKWSPGFSVTRAAGQVRATTHVRRTDLHARTPLMSYYSLTVFPWHGNSGVLAFNCFQLIQPPLNRSVGKYSSTFHKRLVHGTRGRAWWVVGNIAYQKYRV